MVVARPAHGPPKCASLTAAVSPPLPLRVPPGLAQPLLLPRDPRVQRLLRRRRQRPLPPRQPLPQLRQPMFQLLSPPNPVSLQVLQAHLLHRRTQPHRPRHLPRPRPLLDPPGRRRPGLPRRAP